MNKLWTATNRWKLFRYLTSSLAMFIGGIATSKPESWLEFVGTMAAGMGGFAVLMVGWVIYKNLDAQTVVAPVDPIGPPRFAKRYGPHFPIGRYTEMVAYMEGATRSAKEQSFRLSIQLQDTEAILVLAEKIYDAMDHICTEFRHNKEYMMSTTALCDAEGIIILRNLQLKLLQIYTDATGKLANYNDDHYYYFRLPEENIKSLPGIEAFPKWLR